VSRALVLGGGGLVGVAWQAGLLTGLVDAGVQLGLADLVIGTSAGSVVGAQLTTNRVLADVVGPMSKLPPFASGIGANLDDLAEMFREPPPPTSEDEFVAGFAFLQSAEWPATFRCTSFAIDSGKFKLWDRSDGVELHRAVASSCSIPIVSPAVRISGSRYIDGGARDMLNADLAQGHDVVVAVSCMVLDPPAGLAPELLTDRLPSVRDRVEALRSNAGAVAVVEPSAEMCELSGWGRYLMDFARTDRAFDVGLRQGATEAARLGEIWTS
jgi:NTE family protein